MTKKDHIRKLDDIIMDSMLDDACGGCCSWNTKYEPSVNENLNKGDNIDQMQNDLIKYYLKGYLSVSELSKALKILDKYKKERE